MSGYAQFFYHVFNLPENLLPTLTPRNLVGQSAIEQPKEPVEELATPTPPTKGSTGCNICPAANFSSVDEQRAHFRSDWHRYNVKIRLNGGAAVGEVQFAQLIDELEDSISGSESSSDDDDADGIEDDAVSALVNKTKHKLRVTGDEDEWENSRQQPLTPITWFHSPPATQIGVYRNVFQDPTQQPIDSLNELKEMQKAVPGGRKWAMFMVAGGHFAGAIIRVGKDEDDVPPDGIKRKKQQKQKPNNEVLQHKTFHRYTTRRKQGGSQSTNDNAKGPAKSAGALLRRYGEQALKDDIRALLSEWAEDLYDCERIWIRASVQNRKIFIEYEGSVIEKGDQRLRGIPFPTRRPTQSEIARCLMELTRVKISHLTEEALQAQDQAYLASLSKPKPAPKTQEIPPKPKIPAPLKLSKEEELLREKWERLLEMISKGRLDSFKSFWSREGESMIGAADARIPEWASAGQGRTLLQFAAHSGQEDLTRCFLEELRADPTLKGIDDSDERTAYDFASTKEARNVFRRCAATHPDWWDWFGAARVPSALTQEMEGEQEEKKKAKRKGLKDRVKERETKEKEKAGNQAPVEEVIAEPQLAPTAERTGPRRLGGAAAKGAQESLTGLTPEMKMRVEREQRARAAEARLKALSNR